MIVLLLFVYIVSKDRLIMLQIFLFVTAGDTQFDLQEELEKSQEL